MSTQNLIKSLGYAGLLPFVLAAATVLAGAEHAALAAAFAGAYAFGIVSFLTGTWWGLGLLPGSRWPILLSNVVFLVALAAYWLMPQRWPLVAALLLIAIFALEKALIPAFPAGYRVTRAALTLVASLSMLTIFLAG